MGAIGNVLHTKDIEAAIEKGRNVGYDKRNFYTQKSVGLDPGFGSSNFGVCITELRDGLVNVVHAEEYPRPDFNQMISTTVNLLEEYDVRFDNSCQLPFIKTCRWLEPSAASDTIRWVPFFGLCNESLNPDL